MNAEDREMKLKEFVTELSGFANAAQESLRAIELDPHGNKSEFDGFAQMMIAIRGTALQLGMNEIAEMAGLGEEIAVKAPSLEKGSQIKKSVAALWDALTTVKFLLMNPGSETSEEREILRNRLQASLRSFGGARETVSSDEIDRLLRGEG
jgi:hypothetical protein